MGPSNAQKAGEELLATVQQRAEAIVQRGGHVSVAGLMKQLTAQAESMVSHDSPAPVTEMVFGVQSTFGIGNILWNLLPQVLVFCPPTPSLLEADQTFLGEAPSMLFQTIQRCFHRVNMSQCLRFQSLTL